MLHADCFIRLKFSRKKIDHFYTTKNRGTPFPFLAEETYLCLLLNLNNDRGLNTKSCSIGIGNSFLWSKLISHLLLEMMLIMNGATFLFLYVSSWHAQNNYAFNFIINKYYCPPVLWSSSAIGFYSGHILFRPRRLVRCHDKILWPFCVVIHKCLDTI